jgi:hypothetical protein
MVTRVRITFSLLCDAVCTLNAVFFQLDRFNNDHLAVREHFLRALDGRRQRCTRPSRRRPRFADRISVGNRGHAQTEKLEGRRAQTQTQRAEG